MQVNLDCKKPCPHFGNFLIAGEKGTSIVCKEGSEFVKIGQEMIDQYIVAKSKLMRRGFAQYKKGMAKLKTYDVIYNWLNSRCEVVNNKTKKIVASFEHCGGNTGIEHFGITRFPGRKKFAKLFIPKRFLPYNFILAGEKAKELEKAAIAEEKAKNEMINIFN